MPDLRALQAILKAIEEIADKGPDWSRDHLADLINEYRPALAFALLRGDEQGFSHALDALMMMVRRYVMVTLV
jgi:hypothetical protein